MAYLIVQQTFAIPLTDEEHDRMARRLDPCLEQHGARWIRTYLAADRTQMVCEFEADDAEAVRGSYRSANLPFDRVWRAEKYEAQQPTIS